MAASASARPNSLFSTFTGYSSGVSNDGLVPYGPFDTHQIAYTFTGGNGFTAAIALEEGGGNDNETITPAPGADQADIYALDSYVPHVVGGVGWTGGWGGVSVVAGYDAVFEEGAIKGRVDFNAGDAISLFVMAGWGTHDDDINDAFLGVDIDDSPNYYAPWGGEWAVWVGGAWKFTEQATFNFEVGYDDFATCRSRPTSTTNWFRTCTSSRKSSTLMAAISSSSTVVKFSRMKATTKSGAVSSASSTTGAADLA